jgi:LmeA-like phospholipid-binding
MSTDPTKQPVQPPVPPPEEPPATAAPPTVQAPAQPAARWGQEVPTQPVPQWPAPPPPPPGPKQDRPEPPPPPAPTVRTPQSPTRVDQGGLSTRQDRLPPPPPPPQQQRPPQGWQQPAQGWQQPQPQWQQEPQDVPPSQWSPQPGTAQPPAQPPVPPGQSPRFRRRTRKRRVRRSVMAVFTVIVILILLVIGDRVALAVTENDMASQFQQNGLPVKPSVTIEGFPFLTQLAAKDFNKVDISASNIPVNLPTGGSLSITSIHATINGLHISSYSSTASARVDHITATAFVSFGALAAAGGVGDGTGITLAPDGTNKVKITAGIGGVFSDTEEAQISQTGPQTISIKVLPSSGALSSVLSSFGSFSFNLPPGVPASLKITNLTLDSQGLTVSAAATNATFSKS